MDDKAESSWETGKLDLRFAEDTTLIEAHEAELMEATRRVEDYSRTCVSD